MLIILTAAVKQLLKEIFVNFFLLVDVFTFDLIITSLVFCFAVDYTVNILTIV